MAGYMDPNDLEKLHLNDNEKKGNVMDIEHSSDIATEPYRIAYEEQTRIQYCSICCDMGEQVLAVEFCKDDDEYLCELCCKRHRLQRATKNHTLTRLQNIKLGDVQQCESSSRLPPEYERRSPLKQNVFNDPYGETPEQPLIMDINADSVTLTWSSRHCDVECFEIRYKSTSVHDKYKTYRTKDNENVAKITGLKGSTTYVFQVRCVWEEKEGDYSPPSNEITTGDSLASRLLPNALKLDENSPPKYRLCPVEFARSEEKRIKKVQLGHQRSATVKEKTIMLVGATGSGKSTLVDGMINYVTGVNFDDPYRFTLLQLEEEERKTDNQAMSQTEWITVYKIAHHPGGRLDYTLTIIDTPGFGDTRGIKRDHEIKDQIDHLFSSESKEGVTYLDAVCFIVKAPDARLTAVQHYIFHSIMSLFGRDVESNICTLITFADGQQPQVLASLKEADIPFGEWFPFNNSALFAENKSVSPEAMSRSFWKMGLDSFKQFFVHLDTLSSQSISQTKDVLKERQRLQDVVENIHPQITAGLSKLHEMKNEVEILKQHTNEIKKNKNFTYKVKEVKLVHQNIPEDWFVTNCTQCHTTCHKKCCFKDNEEKQLCAAMDQNLGRCMVCMQHCDWFHHKNASYIIRYVEETVTRTYKDKKEKYEELVGKKLDHQAFVTSLMKDIVKLFQVIRYQMQDMYTSKNILKKIALRADPLSTVEHIDLMIEAEKISHQVGFQERIQMLRLYREYAQTDSKVAYLASELKITQEELNAATEKDSTGDKERSSNLAKRLFKRLGKGFNLGF